MLTSLRKEFLQAKYNLIVLLILVFFLPVAITAQDHSEAYSYLSESINVTEQYIKNDSHPYKQKITKLSLDKEKGFRQKITGTKIVDPPYVFCKVNKKYIEKAENSQKISSGLKPKLLIEKVDGNQYLKTDKNKWRKAEENKLVKAEITSMKKLFSENEPVLSRVKRYLKSATFTIKERVNGNFCQKIKGQIDKEQIEKLVEGINEQLKKRSDDSEYGLSYKKISYWVDKKNRHLVQKRVEKKVSSVIPFSKIGTSNLLVRETHEFWTNTEVNIPKKYINKFMELNN